MRRVLGMLALALLLSSCSKQQGSTPLQPAVNAIPDPNSPTNSALAVLACWGTGTAPGFATLLTDDFRFVFAAGDSAGNAFVSQPWTREDELASTYHLIVGGGPHPPARDFQLTFGQPLAVRPDPRPGKDPIWHKLVSVSLTLTMKEYWASIPNPRIVQGYAQFYVVRGDSAAIPADLLAYGWRPDRRRWWLERWEDLTVAPQEDPPSLAGELRHTSWGQLKTDYR